jgi:energy-coupling factor transporter ATP-binding protein EcfA2
MKLHIENFRCFSGAREIELRPITLLTGENSSGKSTIMAALNIIADRNRFPLAPDFNREPFNLGNYNTIASYKGGRYGRAGHFSLGLSQDEDRKPQSLISGRYVQQKGAPASESIKLQNTYGTLSIDFAPAEPKITVEVAAQSPELEQTRVELGPGDRAIQSLSSLQDMLVNIVLRTTADRKDAQKLFTSIFQILTTASALIPTVRSIAPIRSKPSRTYDQAKDEYSPEGTHIPYVLAKLYTESSTDKRAASILRIIEEYGKESGLFTSLKPKILGNNYTDPFQLNILASGIQANIIDVGYGVSQALPIIVQSLLASPNEILLVQQPEVHLHPRAQAAMGSFYANLVREHSGKIFCIETHSDYIADRIRMAVAKKSLPPSDVLFVFIERIGHDHLIHQMEIDEDGNLLKAPSSYRQFFMREQADFLEMGSNQ